MSKVTKTTTLNMSFDSGPITLTREFPPIIVGGVTADVTLIGFAKDIAPEPDDIVSLNEAMMSPASVVDMLPVFTDNLTGHYRTVGSEIRSGWTKDPVRREALHPEAFGFEVLEMMGDEYYAHPSAPDMKIWPPEHHIEDVWCVTGPGTKGPRLFTTMYHAVAFIMKAVATVATEDQEDSNV